MIHVCVVTYYFVCLERKQFFSLVTRYYRFSLQRTLNLFPPLEGVRNKGGRLYTVLLQLKFQTDVEKQR